MSEETPFYTRISQIIVALIGTGFLIILGKPILCPLVIALLLSLLLLPIADVLETKCSMKRGLAATLAVLLFISLLAGMFILLGMQFKHIMTDWPKLKVQLTNSFRHVQTWGSTTLNVDFQAKLNNAKSKFFNPDSNVITATLMSVSSVLFFLVFLVFDTFFLLFYRTLLFNFLVSVFKRKNSVLVSEIVNNAKMAMRSYILGIACEMLIIIGTCSGAFFAIGISYPILFGLIVGLFNIVPYAGILSASIMVIFITIATGTTTKVLLVMAVLLAVHLIDSNFILPFIVGSRVRINALITILGLAIGEMMWHIPGMFLSIPVLGILKIICDRIDELKPYGLLLGDDKKYNRWIFIRRRNEETSNTE
jgi:putative permease